MLRFVRVVLPGLLMVAGIVVIGVGGVSEPSLQVGIPIFSAGASILFLNILWRVAVASTDDRDTEEDARQYFAKHGRWPDEPASGTGAHR